MHEREILLAALEKPRPEEREAYLAQACGTDAALRKRVESLLRASEVQDSFLERPAFETELLNSKTDALSQKCMGHVELSLNSLQPTDDPQALGRLGYYEVVEVLGRGGFGVVFKARDTKLDRIVAVKTLAQSLASSATARKRFVREAKAAAAVKHENVVGIYHVADDGPVPYLVMECVSGVSLETKLQEAGTLDLPAILRIGTQIASGLAAAHKQGLVHRDVKPGNILLENGVERVKITDFGLARAADDAAITRTGEVAGTPQYMSPEQAQGLPLDGRSDLFSLGSVLYAMGTGRSPFRAESTVAALRRVCDDTPRPIREINGDIPDWLADIINRLLAKQPNERFQTATEVADLLGHHLAEVQRSAIVPSPKPTIVLPRRPWAMESRWWPAAAIALVAVVCAIGLTEASGVTKVMPTVIRIVRGEGTLVIELDDPTVQVSLDGEELSIRGAGLQELKLTAGKYRLQAAKDGQPVKDEVVTISRDGRKVVTVTRESPGGTASPSVASADKAPRGELKPMAKLDGHTYVVRAVAFLPDGQRLVSVGQDKQVFVWDLETRSVLTSFAVESSAREADISADGRLVGMVSSGGEMNGRAHVWDLERQVRLGEFIQDFKSTERICFSPDGTHIVTSGRPSSGVLWDLKTGTEQKRFKIDDTTAAQAAAFSPDGRLLAFGTNGGRVHLFDVASGALVSMTQLTSTRSIEELSFSASGARLASSQMDGHVSLIDVASRQVTTSFRASATAVSGLQFLNGDRFVIAGSLDGTVRIWDIEQKTVISTAASTVGSNQQVAVSPDGRFAVTAGGDHFDEVSKKWKATGDYALRLWQLPESVWPKEPTPASSTTESPAISSVVPAAKPSADDLTLLAKLDGHTDLVRAAAFLPDGRRMVSVSHDKLARIWDLPTRTVLSMLPAEGPMKAVDVSPDGRLVAVVLEREGKGVARVWDIEKREVVCQFAPELNSMNYVRFAPDGTRLVTSGVPMSYGALWDAATGRELGRFDMGDTVGVHQAAFSRDARLLAIGASGRVRLFDVESRDVVADVALPTPWNVWDLAVAPSGKTLATGQGGGHVSLIDVDSGRVIKTLQGSPAPVHSLRFLGNDTFLMTCSYDATLRVWDLEQERVVARAATGNGTNHGLFVSPDGRQVITAGGKEWDDVSRSMKDYGDYALRLWQLPESVWPKESPSPSSSTETTEQAATPKNP